tara:strand:- start:20228 stop:21586 length:1359 start_codon:yes stop_codon:yes gene_type:complete
LLGLVEGCIFIAATFAGAWLRFAGDVAALESLGPLLPRAIIFACVILLAMVSMGVYQAQTNYGLSGIMLRTAVSFLFGALVLAVLFYLFPNLFLGRGIIAFAAAISFLCLWALRYLFIYKFQYELLKRKVLVLGTGHRAQNLLDRVKESHSRSAFEILGFLPLQGEVEGVIDEEFRLSLNGQSLSEYAVSKGVQELVVALDDRRKSIPIDGLLDCKLNGIEVLDVLSFFERETGRIIVDLLHPSWLVFSDGFQTNGLQSFAKRCCDFVASSLLLLVFWPFMLITAIAIKIEDGWDSEIFYKQERVGLNGKTFWVYKFRSMRKDAEKAGAQWASANDARVTKVGAIIRQYRIDELAQVFNVLKGDMAIVGPRPERPVFVEHLSTIIPYYAERHRVKPGVTGWAQLCYPYGASDEDSKNKLEYDMYYAKNNSLLLDVLILMQTVEVILFGKGAR